MEKCSWCNIEKHEDDFYSYSSHKMRYGGFQKAYFCKECSDRHYGDKWYPITGYDQKYDISNKGDVRELRGKRYYLISFVQNASTEYVYLSKNGKNMRKNIGPLMKRFVYKGTK